MHRTSSKDVADPWTLDDVDDSAGTTRNLGAWVLATWVGVAMVVLLPALTVYLTPTPKGATWLFALIVTTISGSRYMWIVADGRRRLWVLGARRHAGHRSRRGLGEAGGDGAGLRDRLGPPVAALIVHRIWAGRVTIP